MRLENPVADINDVNVLLDDDVSGEHAVVHPVAEAALGGRGVGPSGPVEVAAQVVGFAAGDFAESSRMNAANHFDERGAIANLEANVEAELAFGALANVDDFFRAGHVDGHGLFEINVLGGRDDGFEVLRMKIRRSGNDDGVDVFGGSNFVESVGADEELRGINRAEAFGLLQLVEIGVGGIELVLKHVGKRDNPRTAGVNEIGGVLRAAAAAAEQAYTDCGVGRCSADKIRIYEHEASGGSGRAYEFATVEVVGGVCWMFCIV